MTVSDRSVDAGHDETTGIYWEAVGDGPPVLLVGGIGMDAGAWWRTVPVLAAGFRVLTFDPRGSGRSGPSPLLWSTEDLAGDCLAVLDAAGVQTAHVYGFSLGGMVAQQLALHHPDRVRRLVLGSTAASGMVFGTGAGMIESLANPFAGDPTRAALRSAYGRRCRTEHPERIEQDLERCVPYRLVTHAAQMGAALAHDARAAVRRIEIPTLVVHGAEDPLVPVAEGRRLAEAIPGAQLLVLPHAGHFYATEEPGTDGRIAAFLAAAGS